MAVSPRAGPSRSSGASWARTDACAVSEAYHSISIRCTPVASWVATPSGLPADAGRDQRDARLGGRGAQAHRALVRGAHAGAQPQPGQPAADRGERAPRRTWPPAGRPARPGASWSSGPARSPARPWTSTSCPPVRAAPGAPPDRPFPAARTGAPRPVRPRPGSRPRCAPPRASRRWACRAAWPGRAGPRSARASDISSSASSSLRDRIGSSRACRARSSSRPADEAAARSTRLAATARSPCASRAVSSPVTVSPTMIGTLTAPAVPVGRPAPAGRASPSAYRRSSTPSAERVAHRQPQAVQVGAGLGRPEHRGQALLGPGQGLLGAAADLPHDRLDQPGQLRAAPGPRPARCRPARRCRPRSPAAATRSAENAATAATSWIAAHRSAMSSR